MTEALPAASATSTTQAERARRVEEAVHSIRMEGLDVSPEGAADAAAYVAGTITLDEYGRRTRARYGVPEVADQGSAAGPRAVADMPHGRPMAGPAPRRR